MLTWAVWAAIGFVTAVLVELIRMNLLLFRALDKEQKMEIPGDEAGQAYSPLISVVIPAKDEGLNIEQSVRAVLASDYTNLQLVLTDDRSEDTTREIMERLAEEDRRIEVVSIRRLPPGWTGKTHALYQGGERALGEILLFTDADTILRGETIRYALHHFVTKQLDMLSLLPQFQERRFSENAVYPHLALGFSSMYPLNDVNDPTREGAFASGCFIMIGKRAYNEVGTWKRFKQEISEDVALSKAVKAEGLRLNVLRGGDLVRTKPFDRLSDVCRFWKRTFYGGLEKSIPKIARVTGNYVFLTVLFGCFVLSSTSMLMGKTAAPNVVLFVLSSLAMTAIVIPYGYVVKLEGGSPWYGLSAPLGILISAWVAFTALFAVVSGSGIRWRGSIYK